MKFIENRKKYLIASLTFFVIGILFIIVNSIRGVGAFNYDVEFSGGTSIQADLGRDFSNDDITKLINDTIGIDKPQVQKILGTNQVAVKMRSLSNEERLELTAAIREEYGISEQDYILSDVSAVISSEMQTKAVLAVAVACVAMLIYVGIRFKDFFMGASAVLALLHDSIAVILTYAIFRIPLNYTFIAVVLTILGYSINATIIIFDRVRENRKLMNKPKPTHITILNTSINQTLTRTIYTTITTLLTVACIYIFGVPTLKDFALPIIVGLLFGTYSSVCLSGSIWYIISGNANKEVAKA